MLGHRLLPLALGLFQHGPALLHRLFLAFLGALNRVALGSVGFLSAPLGHVLQAVGLGHLAPVLGLQLIAALAHLGLLVRHVGLGRGAQLSHLGPFRGQRLLLRHQLQLPLLHLEQLPLRLGRLGLRRRQRLVGGRPLGGGLPLKLLALVNHVLRVGAELHHQGALLLKRGAGLLLFGQEPVVVLARLLQDLLRLLVRRLLHCLGLRPGLVDVWNMVH